MRITPENIEHARRLLHPVLTLASGSYLADLRSRMIVDGVVGAVRRRDTATLFGWLLGLVQMQGVSDRAAWVFIDRHGLPTWFDIERELARGPACGRLQSYWHFADCGYVRSSGTCAAPHLLDSCPVPVFPLRNGRLSQAAFSLFLFLRNVCDGDLVGWLDQRLLAGKTNERHHGGRLTEEAVLGPLSAVYGVSRKVLSMALADLLLGGDPGREHWVGAGAGLVAVDSLVHAFLHRTGLLRRFGAEHAYGPACYGPDGCEALIRLLAHQIDARDHDPAGPRTFPRLIQSAIWTFCATGERNICNGVRIDDSIGCRQVFCPVRPQGCDRAAETSDARAA